MKKIAKVTVNVNLINIVWVGWDKSDANIVDTYYKNGSARILVGWHDGNITNLKIVKHPFITYYSYDMEENFASREIYKNGVRVSMVRLDVNRYRIKHGNGDTTVDIVIENGIMTTHRYAIKNIEYWTKWYSDGMIKSQIKRVDGRIVYRRTYKQNGVIKVNIIRR